MAVKILPKYGVVWVHQGFESEWSVKYSPIRIGAACQPCMEREGLAVLASDMEPIDMGKILSTRHGPFIKFDHFRINMEIDKIVTEDMAISLIRMRHWGPTPRQVPPMCNLALIICQEKFKHLSPLNFFYHNQKWIHGDGGLAVLGVLSDPPNFIKSFEWTKKKIL